MRVIVNKLSIDRVNALIEAGYIVVIREGSVERPMTPELPTVRTIAVRPIKPKKGLPSLSINACTMNHALER